MEQIRKDIVLAAVVRTFFRYFATGVLEQQATAGPQAGHEPRDIKRAMLNHYGRIAPAFNVEAFYTIFQMNYSEAELEPVLRDGVSKCATQMELVRLACRTEEFYSAMVSEYKRNFEQLLCGRLDGQDGAESSYTPCPSAGEMPVGKAESLINRMAANAYQQGKKAAREAR